MHPFPDMPERAFGNSDSSEAACGYIGLTKSLIVSLSTLAKQRTYRIDRFPRQQHAKLTYCLAPDFFLISIPSSSSATSIMAL